ncbi:hypothetical protein G7K_6128-t1 [Saitoella complicata NRRL Y-17804]|uniref:CRAL-TRIO domain-containing protein n=1 Tax=Saitoella complicata (strain BCRC 22490 / CBS 7301 / JCM 7358 / NBRC 10748 / NRRL Y-17804) TaxID=698492 RepID=A0A0E9NRI8_SAICN|nr:hypothetical protein G7K_6128-t1 [Saitoella complicata NRRL Y-17804]
MSGHQRRASNASSWRNSLSLHRSTSNTPSTSAKSPPSLSAANNGGGHRTTPFENAHPSITPMREPAPVSDQENKVQALIKHFSQLRDLPVSSDRRAGMQALSDEEKCWLSRECMLRYLRATKGDLAEAQKRLEGSIVWRRGWGLGQDMTGHVEPEATTGKQVLLGFDSSGRPCLYLYPSRQNTKPSQRQIEYLVWGLERAIDMMPRGVENLALLINFKGSGSSTTPSLSQGKQVMSILQTHYPERLGRALIINVPFFVNGFFKLITPFIDPNTREKMVFNADLRNHVPPSQLDRNFGGDCEFEYVHGDYWPELSRLARERRERNMRNWRVAGGGVGISEDVIKSEVAPEQEKPATAQQAVTEPSRSPAPAFSPAPTAATAPAPIINHTTPTPPTTSALPIESVPVAIDGTADTQYRAPLQAQVEQAWSQEAATNVAPQQDLAAGSMGPPLDIPKRKAVPEERNDGMVVGSVASAISDADSFMTAREF